MTYPEQYDAMNHTTLTPKVGVGVVIIRDGKFLLLQRSMTVSHGQGKWSVVGGHVELGETVRHAATREVEEEVGVEIAFVTTLGWAECMLPEYHSISVFIQADILCGEPEILEPEKADALGFFTYAELGSLSLFEPFERFYKSGRLKLVQQ